MVLPPSRTSNLTQNLDGFRSRSLNERDTATPPTPWRRRKKDEKGIFSRMRECVGVCAWAFMPTKKAISAGIGINLRTGKRKGRNRQ